MDPNATLKDIRELYCKIIEECDNDTSNLTIDDWKNMAEFFAERVEALDIWLSDGGFLPRPWTKSRDI